MAEDLDNADIFDIAVPQKDLHTMVISLFVNGRCRHLSLGMIAINTKGTTQLSQVTR